MVFYMGREGIAAEGEAKDGEDGVGSAHFEAGEEWQDVAIMQHGPESVGRVAGREVDAVEEVVAADQCEAERGDGG